MDVANTNSQTRHNDGLNYTENNARRALGLWLWMGLLGLAWLQPDHFPPWLSIHSEVLSFCFAIVGLILTLKGSDKSSHYVTFGWPEYALAFVVALVMIQYAVGIISYSGDVVILLQYVGGLIFTICTGRAIGGREGILEKMAWAILIAGLCSTAIALFQSTRPYDDSALINLMPGWRRPGANMGQANHFGTLALWSIASVAFLVARKMISWRGGVFLVAVLLMGAAMSESRTALVGVVVVSLWVTWLPKGWTRRVRLSVAATLIFGGFSLFMAWPRLLAGIQEGGWDTSGAAVTTINTQGGARFVVWHQLLQAITLRPLFGWGFGGVSSALNAVADLYTETYPFTYAHSIVLDLLVWFGMPLTSALVVAAGLWAWRRFQGVRGAGDWYAVALLIPFVLHSLLEFPFAYAYFLFPAGFLIGVLDSQVALASTPFRVRRGAIWMLLLVWVMAGIEVLREYRLAEEDYRVARAEALRIGKTPVDYSKPILPLLTQLDALNEAVRFSPATNMGADDIEALRLAALRFPSISVQKRYAMSLALNGEVNEAQRQLKVIRAMHGDRVHDAIVAQWSELALGQYPQLRGLVSE